MSPRYMWYTMACAIYVWVRSASVLVSVPLWLAGHDDGHQTTEASHAQSSKQRTALSATSRNLIALVRSVVQKPKTQPDQKPTSPRPKTRTPSKYEAASAAEQTSHLVSSVLQQKQKQQASKSTTR